MNPMLIAAIAPVVQDILGLFRKVDANEIPLMEAKAKIEQILNDRLSIFANLLQGQIEINKIESEAGRLGWRNWLGKWTTVGFLYGTFGVPLIMSLLALATLVGLPVESVNQVKALLPAIPHELIMPILMGLLGLYGARGYEKTQYSKQINDFNKTAFFSALREANGGSLTQLQVNTIEQAFKNMDN